MTDGRFKVGIIGLEPNRSWAARAHVPALQALSHDFEITGVANTSEESAERAVAAIGSGKAFSDVAELLADPEIDIVAVTVRVGHHFDIVRQAIKAGKHVYCEWPLGNGLPEAEELARLARERGVLGVIGMQARVAPEVRRLKQLVKDGFVGEVLSTAIVARAGGWGGIIPHKKDNAYLLEKSGGATMLTIPVGHALAAVVDALGPIDELSSVLATRRTTAFVADTGEILPVDAPDQVLICGTLKGGAPISLHYRGGMPRGDDGFIWEINGTKGDLRLTAPFGHPQLAPLVLKGARGDEKELKTLDTSDLGGDGFPPNAASGNVARLYSMMANDLRSGSRTAPNFDSALVIHRVLDAIERSSASGQRVSAWK
jgi:predicted dehydrogenase